MTINIDWSSRKKSARVMTEMSGNNFWAKELFNYSDACEGVIMMSGGQKQRACACRGSGGGGICCAGAVGVA